MTKIKTKIVLLFALVLAQPVFGQGDGQVVDKIVAIVGDNIVLYSEVESQVLQATQQGMPDDAELRCRIIEEMLFSKLLLNKAQFDSVEVPENQIQTELDRRMNYFITQVGDEAALEKIYGKTIEQIKAELHDLLEEQMMAQQIQGTITSNVKVTPAEVRKYFNSIPADSLPYIGSQIEVAHIVIHPKITPEARRKVIDQLTKIRTDIVDNGRSFETMAVLHSKDGSAKDGGDLGWLTRGDLVSEFSAAAFSLSTGEVSGIVETEFGFHLIKMLERRGERIHCRHILITPTTGMKEQEIALNKLDSVRNLIEVDSLTFKKAAELYSDDEETSKSNGILSNPRDGSTRFDMELIDPQLFFAIDKLDIGEISMPVQFEDRNGAAFRIVRLNKRSEPHVANLIDDYDLISRVALNDKKSKEMNKWIADQVGKTYIKLDDAYNDCEFTYGWKKAQ